MVEKTLVIGDAHVDPEQSNERFDALGQYIMQHKPDNIVQIGDFLSLDSISFHDKNNVLIREGKRLAHDIEAGKAALYKIMKPVNDDNEIRQRCHQKLYKPNKFWLLGNHEYRVFRYLSQNPVLEGLMFNDASMVDAGKWGWKIIPYKDYIYINGIGFTHCPMNRRNNQPIGGEHVARRALEIQNQSVVFGHSHRLLVHDMARNNQGECNYIQGISVGWFGDYIPYYVKGNEQTLDWWSGLVELTHYAEGKIDITTISMEKLKREYL